MNNCTFIGNLTHDPELKETATGQSYCKFSIAVNRPYMTDDEKKVDFFEVVAWNKVAKNVATYLKKGNKVCVVGAVEIDDYTARDGTKRRSISVKANQVEFLQSVNNQASEQANSPEIGQSRTKPILKPVAPEDDPFSDCPF